MHHLTDQVWLLHHVFCRALESQDYTGAVEAYTAALAVDPQHRNVNKQLQLGLCKVQQQLGKAEEAVQVCQGCFRAGFQSLL